MDEKRRRQIRAKALRNMAKKNWAVKTAKNLARYIKQNKQKNT